MRSKQPDLIWGFFGIDAVYKRLGWRISGAVIATLMVLVYLDIYFGDASRQSPVAVWLGAAWPWVSGAFLLAASILLVVAWARIRRWESMVWSLGAVWLAALALPMERKASLIAWAGWPFVGYGLWFVVGLGLLAKLRQVQEEQAHGGDG